MLVIVTVGTDVADWVSLCDIEEVRVSVHEDDLTSVNVFVFVLLRVGVALVNVSDRIAENDIVAVCVPDKLVDKLCDEDIVPDSERDEVLLMFGVKRPETVSEPMDVEKDGDTVTELEEVVGGDED